MNAEKLTVVVEGRSDVEILRSVLGRELASRLRFFAGQGLLSLATLARDILIYEGGPVLVVLDADTSDARQVEEARSMTMMAIVGATEGRLCPPDLVQVFVFVPCIEVIFFEVPSVLERALGKEIPDAVVREGLLAPKPVLERLMGNPKAKSGSKAHLADLLTESAAILASSQQARMLHESVLSLLRCPTTT